MTIEVTQDDINYGKDHSCENCPVALALTRATGHKCMVNYSGWRFYPNTGQGVYPISPEVNLFIRNFDRKIGVNPIKFEINYDRDNKD